MKIIMRIIKLIFVTLFIAGIILFAVDKINKIKSTNVLVNNFKTLHEEKGIPVYTRQIGATKVAQFIRDMTLLPNDGTSKVYNSFVSKDVLPLIKQGAKVYVPVSKEAFEEGFNPDNSQHYVTGRVLEVSKDIDWQSGFYKVPVEMDRKMANYVFYPSKVVVEYLNNVIVVPITNLENKDNKYFAWIVDENSRAKRVDITTGTCDGYNCEIKSGLKAGDYLITSDLKVFKEGSLLNNVGENK